MRLWSLFATRFGQRQFPLADALHFLHSSEAILLRMFKHEEQPAEEENLLVLRRIAEEAQDISLLAFHLLAMYRERHQKGTEGMPPSPEL